MDRVRFGRALGYGARHAAKAVVKAVDAATTPSPGRAEALRPRAGTAGSARMAEAAERLAAAQQVVSQVKSEARKQTHGLARSAWSSVARLSGVLWLEVTGTFFAVIAAYLSQGLWRQRGALRLPMGSAEAGKYYLHVAAFAVFAYFAVSSFVRARRRQGR